MALESNAWLTTNNTASNSTSNPRNQQNVVKSQREAQLDPQQQQQFVNEAQQQRGLLKIPTSVGKCSMFTQTEPTNRFTQTDHPPRYNNNNNASGNNSCLEPSSVSGCNKPGEPSQQSAMFDPSSMQQQQQQQTQNNNGNPQQMYPGAEVKPPGQQKDDQKNNATIAEFPFCYNVNMLQKVHQTQNAIPVSGIADDKGCYRFDVAQPFGYNYALVNQMSLAAAASSATFKCDVCGLVFGHLSLLNHHKRIHNTNVANANAERQYSCDVCGACFNLPGELKSHKTGMHGKNAQSAANKCCDSCGVEMASASCEHQQGGAAPVGTKSAKKGKFVKCENCEDPATSAMTTAQSNSVVSTVNFVVAGEGQIRETVSVVKPGHHPVKRRGVASVTKCHKCNGSGIIFIGGTKNGGPNVDKPFHCNVCDGTFSRYSSLWSHKRLHSGEKNFKCDICGLAFAKAAYLKNHNRVHTGEKPFKCAVCGMQFSQSPHLKNHERIHSGERPYQCEVCEKTFARHSTLWNHRRIHTGEKPYRCEVCGSAFNQATHLKNHAKVHTGEKPYRCDICDVGFSDRFALKRHRSIHEKYGRTAQNGANAQPPQQQQQQQQQPQANAVNSQPSGMEHLYKCEVGGPIAFPGCSRPLEEKQ